MIAKPIAETSKVFLASEPRKLERLPMTVGEIKQPIFTMTRTIVVAKLTEFCGAAHSSQLYIYGTANPKPMPVITMDKSRMAKFCE